MDKHPRLNIPETIETARLVLHRLRYEDADELFYTYASKPEATTFVTWPTHRSILDTRTFLDLAVERWRAGTEYSFSIRTRSHARLIGSFGILNDQGKVQIGYVLGPLHWKQGYATEACRKMVEVLSMTPNVYRVGSFVDAENIASVNVLLKSGFLEEARLPRWFRFINQGNQAKDCILFRLPQK